MDDRSPPGTAPDVQNTKREGAASLRTMADALHQAAHRLDEGGSGLAARYAERAADEVDRFADRLKDASVQDMLHEAERFARRRPEVFVGLAAAAGFLAVRFLKSSGPRARSTNDTDASVRNADVAGAWPFGGLAAPVKEPARPADNAPDPVSTVPSYPGDPHR